MGRKKTINLKQNLSLRSQSNQEMNKRKKNEVVDGNGKLHQNFGCQTNDGKVESEFTRPNPNREQQQRSARSQQQKKKENQQRRERCR